MHDIRAAVRSVPRGQLRAVLALLGGEEARTYRQAAAVMGVHVGTLYTHLRRLRRGHPGVYAAFMAKRAEQLAERHEAALERAAEHSRRWFRAERRRRNYRFKQLTGRWPWQRRR